jgi:CubicO group peptidase (beta-lactamase class C family)
MSYPITRAGMAGDRLERIGAHLQKHYIEAGRIAGCHTLVARHGEVVHDRLLGRMDLERDRPLRADTIYRIYSMTKPITSVALMMLYEEGRFQLNDPVTKFIPQWREQRVWVSGEGAAMQTRAPARPMTMRHLLNHSAGLTYGGVLLPAGTAMNPVDQVYAELKINRSRDDTLETFIDKLARVPLLYEPGSAWAYSLATDVCGYLVQKISGQPFEQFLQQRIIGPLGMVDTAFTIAPDKVERFAACYRRDEAGRLELADDPLASSYARTPALHSGGGGLVSTMADYLRFCEMLRRGGELDGVRLLGPRTLALMHLNHLPGGKDLTQLAIGLFSETTNEGVGFGLGFATTLGEVQAGVLGPGDFYWGGMASTLFWVDPKEDLVVIFLTQLIPSATYNFRGQLKNIVYSALVD